MSLGDPVKINLDAATFVLAAESGVIIQSEELAISSDRKDIWDASVGDIVGYVFYKFLGTQQFSAIVNGTNGLAAAQPGAVLALANDLGIGTNKNGVAAGGTFCTNVTIAHAPEDLRHVSGSTIRRARIAAPG